MAWPAKGRLWVVLALVTLAWHAVQPTRPREEMIPLGKSLVLPLALSFNSVYNFSLLSACGGGGSVSRNASRSEVTYLYTFC